MLLIGISGFFGWLMLREFYWRWVPRAGYDRPITGPIPWGYLALLAALATAAAWSPARTFWLEHRLEQAARALADGRRAHVHCNTFVDTLFDPNSLAAGHAQIETGHIVLQKPWCSRLLDYLSRPQQASRLELAALHIVTHEAMHVRGERDEARTECEAVQRNARTAVLLGVGAETARQSARRIYQEIYLQREFDGQLSHGYWSAQCAPGLVWDEQLPDPPWRSY